MNENEASKQLAQLRTVILRTMAALAEVDLSASSEEYAQSTIRRLALESSQHDTNEHIIRNAAYRVIVCLKWSQMLPDFNAQPSDAAPYTPPSCCVVR